VNRFGASLHDAAICRIIWPLYDICLGCYYARNNLLTIRNELSQDGESSGRKRVRHNHCAAGQLPAAHVFVWLHLSLSERNRCNSQKRSGTALRAAI
jgi:hypothetical protein